MTSLRAPIVLGSALTLLVSACEREPSREQRASVRRDPIVYGEDDRRDVYAQDDVSLRELMRASIVALIPKQLIQRPPSGKIALVASTLHEVYGTCADEPFTDQIVAADCSGTLIDHDLVLTAAHCFNDVPCEDFAFVFDYAYASDGALSLSSTDLYGCAQVVAHHLSSPSEVPRLDFAVVQLDRPVTAPRAPVSIRASALAADASTTVIGFPAGLPGKVDAGGHVIDPRTIERDYFTLDSDTFEGSSGSAIFDADHALAGVLVRGGDDWTTDADAGCQRSRVLAADADGAPWEQATYAFRAVAELCATGWPSPGVCGVEPRCGDAFCTNGETPDSCTADCAGDACAEPPCGKTGVGPLSARDAGPASDAGSKDAAAGADAGEDTKAHEHAGSSCGLRRAGTEDASRRSTWLALACVALGALTRRRARRARAISRWLPLQ